MQWVQFCPQTGFPFCRVMLDVYKRQYLGGGSLTVNGNAQDAVGDTMNGGSIVVRGSVGDTAGYAMRGGEIYVQGNAGYRAGIHMKAYQDQQPVRCV